MKPQQLDTPSWHQIWNQTAADLARGHATSLILSTSAASSPSSSSGGSLITMVLSSAGTNSSSPSPPSLPPPLHSPSPLFPPPPSPPLSNETLPLCLRLVSHPSASSSSSSPLSSPPSLLHLLFFDLSILLPSLLFLSFLFWRLRPSLQRLLQGGSKIVAAFYCLLWFASGISFLRACMEVWGMGSPGAVSHWWDLMWLSTRFLSLLLEVSIVVLMCQGFLVSGSEALARTLIWSAAIAAADTAVKAMLIFQFSVPLFTPSLDASDWSKWGFWWVHETSFAALYGLILVLPYTRWREQLPAKPSFYTYTAALFVFNLAASFGSLQLAFGSYSGYCSRGFATYLSNAIVPPLLYVCFLEDFFNEEAGMADAYFAELRDAGYFDSEWDYTEQRDRGERQLSVFP